MSRIVIIGNGIAGIEAALTVRHREPAHRITIVSEESDHFFSRTALMWVHCGQLSHRDIEPYERDLYARMGFDRVRARAVGLDPERKTVSLADGRALPYDRLLIACGSRPRPLPWPGNDLVGVGHFVTLQDLEWLEREVHGGPSHGGRPPNPDAHVAVSSADSPYRPRPSSSRAGRVRSPVVIGGGLIGIEAVEILVAAGLRPTFVIREEWFWPMALDRTEADWIAERLRAHGVDVRLDENVTRLAGEREIEAVETDQARHAADLCVVAIGVLPNTEWLAGSPALTRDREGGIVVDAGLTTSVRDVFAAGDCASVAWWDGTVRPEQLWYTARAQGRIAGRRLLDDPVTYQRGGWFNSAKLMDIEYTTVGLVGVAVPSPSEFVFVEHSRVRSTFRAVMSEGRVVGFNILGRRFDHSVLLRFIDERRSLDYVLDHLDEARFDTELVPPLRIDRRAPRSRSAEAPRSREAE